MSKPSATIIQQLPTASADSTDVGIAVINHLTILGLPGVAHDHESRIVFGEKKYGQRLKIHNGRNALLDAYQECLDSLSYLMQAHMEGISGSLWLFEQAAKLTKEVEKMLSVPDGK